MHEEVIDIFEKLIYDDSYFEAFYNNTKKKVFYLIYSYVKNTYDAEDLLQETYLSLLKHRSRIKKDTVMSYLYKIAQNKSLNFIKKKKREVPLDYEAADQEEIGQLDYSQGAEELILLMKKVLNDIEFQVVIFHVMDDMTHKEISKLLKKPLGTITWTYQNAIQKVRRCLECQM